MEEIGYIGKDKQIIIPTNGGKTVMGIRGVKLYQCPECKMVLLD